MTVATTKRRRVPGLYLRGRVWWCKYYLSGRAVRESTGAGKETEAKRFLEARRGRVAAGMPVLPRADRVTYDTAAQDLRDHYKVTGTRDVVEAEYRLAHLDRHFRGWRLAAIGQAEATAYAAARQAAGASNGTINRELAVLVRMLGLAYEHGKLLRLPVLHKLKEGDARQGFFERDQYEAVRRHLPQDLQLAIAIAYTFGWRMQSEVLTLERRQVDFAAGTLRLDNGQTKNDEGRVVYVTPEVKALLAAQLARVDDVQRRTGQIIPFVFPFLYGKRRLGQRRRDFRRAWETACTAAGVPGALRHDFRRTAVRNMVNLGVPERVAMKVTGHKTRAVFDRYHIVPPADLQEATRKLADGHNPGTIGVGDLKTRSVSG